MVHLTALKASSSLPPALTTMLFVVNFALRLAITIVIPFRPFIFVVVFAVVVVVPIPSSSFPLLLDVVSLILLS